MSTKTEVLPEVDNDISEFDGKAHYVRIQSLMIGGVVVALCGKKYVPTVVGGSVMDLPLCGLCDELFTLIQSMD